MAFKINISDKGKTLKIETENENLIGKSIGESLDGKEVSADLEEYELEITGTSDISGKPGFEELEGSEYHRELLKYGPGMKDRRKGIRLRKLLRGKVISAKTIQINTITKKQGKKKFEDLLPKKEAPASPENKEKTEVQAAPATQEKK